MPRWGRLDSEQLLLADASWPGSDPSGDDVAYMGASRVLAQ